jgi:hypothetical protein
MDRIVLIAALAVAVGCASGPRGATRNENRITAAELATLAGEDAYQAVERLRPQWLRSRGPTSVTDPSPTLPNVIMHGTQVGGLEYLRQVNLNDIQELRYWPPGEASARFGMGHPRGVIEVIPRG